MLKFHLHNSNQQYRSLLFLLMSLLIMIIAIWCAAAAVSGKTSEQHYLYLPIIRHDPPPRLVINELLASNGTVNYNQTTTEFDDWIELYNSTDQAIDLSGYRLSDEPDVPDKWQIPSGTTIAPSEHLLIWAMGEDMGGLHANFKLSDKGETITLSKPDGTIVDRIEYGKQTADMSIGRLQDGNAQIAYFGIPTPGENNRDGRLDQTQYDRPTTNISGGFYDEAQTIALSGTAGTTLHYTVDGSTPTKQSPRYTTPLVINETTIIKMRVYGVASHPSPIIATTYFIGSSSQLPTISIGVDSAYLFDDQIGIYTEGINGISGICISGAQSNWHQDWERPISIEMYEPDGTIAFRENAGAKIFGGCSRNWPQKSLAIHFRDKYGDDTVNYPIFLDNSDKDVQKHHALVLRNGGQTWRRGLMRDAVAQAVFATEMDWDGQRTRPAVVYINGEYWGIHNIREKLNEDYIEEHHGYDKDKIDILELNREIVEGSQDHYRDMIDYISQNSLSNADAYAYITTQMDVDQYIDYQIGQIYFDNRDWPGSNVKYWRPQQDDGRWRWLTYDLDMSMNWWGGWDALGERNALQIALEAGSEEWPNYDWSTFLFRNLMKNETFRDDFLQRFSLYLDHTFTSDHVKAVINAHAKTVEDEMDEHLTRWESTLDSVETWWGQVDLLRGFAEVRPAIMRTHLESYFAVGSERTAVSLHVGAGSGTIEINTVRVTDATNTVYLYPNRQITLRAVPKPGYRFARWEGDMNSTTNGLTAQLDREMSITAIFEAAPQPIINEIHYNPSSDLQGDDDLYEFVELYNPHDEAIDIGGYMFTSGFEYQFAAGQVMLPNSYVVLAQSADTYADLDAPVYQWTEGGLKNSGEQIMLAAADGITIDSVTYDDEDAWASSPDGDGFSLSLVDAMLDNDIAVNWQASTQMGGTPGKPNDLQD